eukprot:2405679-Alexandrium_andersonii.AAC.1
MARLPVCHCWMGSAEVWWALCRRPLLTSPSLRASPPGQFVEVSAGQMSLMPRTEPNIARG